MQSIKHAVLDLCSDDKIFVFKLNTFVCAILRYAIISYYIHAFENAYANFFYKI